MPSDNFEKSLQRRFNSVEIPPRPEVWEGIQTKLAEPKWYHKGKMAIVPCRCRPATPVLLYLLVDEWYPRLNRSWRGRTYYSIRTKRNCTDHLSYGRERTGNG